MKNRLIKVPENIISDLFEDKKIRVIVLLEEIENQEDNSLEELSKKQFLAGYS